MSYRSKVAAGCMVAATWVALLRALLIDSVRLYCVD
jgi:hypothetical protein